MGTQRADPGMSHRGLSDAGLFGPDSEAWRLDREAMLLLGAGPRALLLQLAHPKVAAGVAEHSDFRADPWRRLDGTLRSYLRIIYGSTAAARGEIRRLNTLHRSIRGDHYDARDPDLSLWVHATLVDSTIVVNDAWAGPLSRDRAAQFYEETKPIARAFGVPDAALPADLDAFDGYLAAQMGPAGPVRVGPTARELAEAILHPPLPGVLARTGLHPRLYDWTLWPSIGLLPPSIREAYGFDWGWRERAVDAWLVTAWRAWNNVLPPGFRQMPQALAADRRAAAEAQ
ncbi:MAG TPA: oxygenase MpaB family protein [Candidatus Limnocylindrales bacterium]|nr:oxygenase MpaB family protein [Candidatus Limnocylindrales bacterium]